MPWTGRTHLSLLVPDAVQRGGKQRPGAPQIFIHISPGNGVDKRGRFACI